MSLSCFVSLPHQVKGKGGVGDMVYLPGSGLGHVKSKDDYEGSHSCIIRHFDSVRVDMENYRHRIYYTQFGFDVMP